MTGKNEREDPQDKRGNWQKDRAPRRDDIKHKDGEDRRPGRGGIGTGMTAAKKGQN